MYVLQGISRGGEGRVHVEQQSAPRIESGTSSPIRMLLLFQLLGSGILALCCLAVDGLVFNHGLGCGHWGLGPRRTGQDRIQRFGPPSIIDCQSLGFVVLEGRSRIRDIAG